MKSIKFLMISLIVMPLILNAAESKESSSPTAHSGPSSSSSASGSSMSPSIPTSIPTATLKVKLTEFLDREPDFLSINTLITAVSETSSSDVYTQQLLLKQALFKAAAYYHTKLMPYYFTLVKVLHKALQVYLTQQDLHGLLQIGNVDIETFLTKSSISVSSPSGSSTSSGSTSSGERTASSSEDDEGDEEELSIEEALEIYLRNGFRISAQDYVLICIAFENLTTKEYIEHREQLEEAFEMATTRWNHTSIIRALFYPVYINMGPTTRADLTARAYKHKNQLSLDAYKVLNQLNKKYMPLIRLHDSYKLISSPDKRHGLVATRAIPISRYVRISQGKQPQKQKSPNHKPLILQKTLERHMNAVPELAAFPLGILPLCAGYLYK